MLKGGKLLGTCIRQVNSVLCKTAQWNSENYTQGSVREFPTIYKAKAQNLPKSFGWEVALNIKSMVRSRS